MKSKTAYLLAILSGILFGLCWNDIIPAFSLFIALVPLLFILLNKEFHYTEIFKYSFISFFLFHLGTVSWLCKSSVVGGLTIMLLNSCAMACIMMLTHLVVQKISPKLQLFVFVIIWLSFEHIHFYWELSWPFMNMGNWLGQIPKTIQWYEYTGILGGSLWILLSNITIYQAITLVLKKRILRASIFILIEIAVIALPLILSNNIYKQNDNIDEKHKFAIIQSNINPYTEKYNSSLFQKQINRQIELAKTVNSEEKICIVYPESSFPKYLNEDSIEFIDFYQHINNKAINGTDKIIMASCYTYKLNAKDTIYYNTSFMVENHNKPQIYHKSKLVVGVEKTPFDSYLSFIKNWNVDFGGFTSSLGIDDRRTVFTNFNGDLRIAPIICYESVYGSFVSEFIKEGANCISVQTNDAWWGETAGYKQHLIHSQMRAIENRKAIVRAANTGTSCFINIKGEIYSQAKEWEETLLINSLSTNNKITFYAKHGNFIGQLSMFFSILIVIAMFIMKDFKINR